jgi:hypothetical protein
VTRDSLTQHATRNTQHDFNDPPSIRFVAHSNGAVIALLVTRRLIERDCWIGGVHRCYEDVKTLKR